MSSYGYEDSQTTSTPAGEYRPYLGLLIGIFIAFVVTAIVSGTVALVFFKYVDFAELQQSTPEIIANSKNFLIILLLLNSVVMVYAGRALGYRTVGKEGAYGIILASFVTIVSLFLFKGYDGFRLFPTWFSLASFVTMYLGIYLGAKSVEVQD